MYVLYHVKIKSFNSYALQNSNSVCNNDIFQLSLPIPFFFMVIAQQIPSNHPLNYVKLSFPQGDIMTVWSLSIHDLMKRSTLGNMHLTVISGLSIHDLTKRSTRTNGLRVYLLPYFQFTTSRRGRPRATLGTKNEVNFQFTTSRRGRPDFSLVCLPGCIFQFTTSRRGRHGKVVERMSRGAFQFTTSRRGRRHSDKPTDR